MPANDARGFYIQSRHKNLARIRMATFVACWIPRFCLYQYQFSNLVQHDQAKIQQCRVLREQKTRRTHAHVVEYLLHGLLLRIIMCSNLLHTLLLFFN